MNFIKKIFCRRKQFKPQPKQLRIDGCKTTLTPTPDDAELAAQALLESRIYGDKEQRKAAKKRQPSLRATLRPSGQRTIRHQTSSTHDAQYYRELSEKIKESHAADARMAMRYVAYCEEQLTSDISHQPSAISHQPSDISHQTSDIATLEHGLFKHQDTVEREGGDLLERWQKCLAECIIRQSAGPLAENGSETLADNANNAD